MDSQITTLSLEGWIKIGHNYQLIIITTFIELPYLCQLICLFGIVIFNEIPILPSVVNKIKYIKIQPFVQDYRTKILVY